MPNDAGPAQSTWSREKIEELLRTEAFHYQRVPLPYGLATEGRDRSGTADCIFPADLAGDSVVDIGCSLGYFCFEARRRGAGRVAGLDHTSENVRKARILADILGEPVEFTVADIERDPIPGPFDHVVCLNVLHHLGDPIATLDRLTAVARKCLVLEIATLGAHDRRKLGTTWLATLGLSHLPAIMVGRGAGERGTKQFYLTPAAVENLLRYRRGCFASLEFKRADFKDRFIVIAHKRRIGHLLVVAGPTASGKGALVSKFLNNELPAINRHLGTDAPGEWGARLVAERYHEPQAAQHDRLIFEYDYLRPVTRDAESLDRDPALDVLDTAERTTFLTLWATPESLLEQIAPAIDSARGRARKDLTRLREQYEDTSYVIDCYRAWLAYAATKSDDHLVVQMNNDGPVFLSPEEWEERVARPLLAAA